MFPWKAGVKPLLRLPPTVKDLLAENVNSEAPSRLSGWVRSVRNQKRVSFAQINDGSCCKDLQAILAPEQASQLSVGASVRMVGHLQESQGTKQTREFRVHSVEAVGQVQPDYPVQKKEHTHAFLRKLPHLRPRTDRMASMLRVRDACSSAVHSFFKDTGHLNVEAPILTNSDCEGGSSVFRVESAEHFSNASPPHQSHIKSFFHSPTYLTVSSQLYLEAISASISRVYTLGPAFRAEPSLTSRHLSEFWMLEQEIAFVDSIDQILDIVEGCVRAAWATASERLPEDLRKLHQSETLPVVPEHWPRINYDQAVDLLRTHHAPVTWGSDLSTEQERWITDQHYKSPVFVTDYPASLKPFYMRKNDQPSPHGSTAACFDLLVPGIGELAGGSLREERLPQLRQAMREKQLHEQDYDWYLDLRRYGSVPHGGFGLGWERLTSWITGLENVRECIAFPRAKEGFEI